mgnify:CR=1 FL=1|jgi:MerR family transcriptional activator of bmr gene
MDGKKREKMNKYYSIGEAAKISDITVPALRHYDKIGLLHPSKTDLRTGYRYYSDSDLMYLRIINFCKEHGMALPDISRVFSGENYEEILAFLAEREKEIEREIELLKETEKELKQLSYQYGIAQDHRFTNKECNVFKERPRVKRIIMKAKHLHEVTPQTLVKMSEMMDTLRDDRDLFVNETIGVTMKEGEQPHLYTPITHIIPPTKDYDVDVIPAGWHLRVYCQEGQQDEMMAQLTQMVQERYGFTPKEFFVKIIFIGMFKWLYEVRTTIPYPVEEVEDR